MVKTVTIPGDRLLRIELPHSMPAGAEAGLEISVLDSPASPPEGIEAIRPLPQKKMSEKWTSKAAGAGWESQVKERYAES